VRHVVHSRTSHTTPRSSGSSLSGTWVLKNDGTTTEEHWRPPPGTTLPGSSRTYDRTNTYFFEHPRITATIGQLDGSRAQSFVFQSFVFQAFVFKKQ